MKRLVSGLVCVTLVGIALSFVGTASVSAVRAYAEKLSGCNVRASEEFFDYEPDPDCKAHEVLKLDDEGNVEFYSYQDHGQTSWRPEKAFRETFYSCTVFEDGLEVCGYVREMVTPNGEYRSTFKFDRYLDE